MLKKLGLVDLVAAVIENIKNNTEATCYDAVPKNAKAPFYFVEVTGKRPENTKTMFCEVFTVWIHAIASKSQSSVGVYKLIQNAEESLSEDIRLPEEFTLILQTELGLQNLKTDETGEKHAVLAYEFKVSYGFKCKV